MRKSGEKLEKVAKIWNKWGKLGKSWNISGENWGSPICAKKNRVLPLCVINGYAKNEVDQ